MLLQPPMQEAAVTGYPGGQENILFPLYHFLHALIQCSPVPVLQV